MAKLFDPRMMVALLLYAYARAERSTRKIKWLCEGDVRFKLVAGNTVPDHTAISRFRQRTDKLVKKLFVDVLRLAAEAGLVKVGRIIIDGTKVKANAALSANRTLKHLQEDIEKYFREADEVDAQEDELYGKDKRGDEMPKDMKHETRMARILQCKARLDAEAAKQEGAQALKVQEHEVRKEASGGKCKGRAPKSPDEAVNHEAKANVTDPESRIMKTQHGFVQGYNAQVAVTTEQIIVSATLT